MDGTNKEMKNVFKELDAKHQAILPFSRVFVSSIKKILRILWFMAFQANGLISEAMNVLFKYLSFSPHYRNFRMKKFQIFPTFMSFSKNHKM